MKKLLLFRAALFMGLLVFIGSSYLSAHPMPNTLVLLKVHSSRIDAELQIPLVELQSAWGHVVNDSSAGLIHRLGPELKQYLKAHIRPESPQGAWNVIVGEMKVTEIQNQINGVYRELVVKVEMEPAVGASIRKFTLHYDAVLHQVVTHQILVSVQEDWERGQLTDEAPLQVGTISTDIVTGKVLPLQVDLATGNRWTGFNHMVKLGMEHIAEGTDHLLFILVLLLPAPLLTSKGRWGRFGGVRYSLRKLLSVITAFTIGHSVTLLVASLGWVKLPSQPIEILIAMSILVSAVHAARPVFPGRESLVAAGFGLIHGLAFAGTLVNLQLDTDAMMLSVLGFNIGIEFMQLFIIGLTIPWLVLLSRQPVYKFVRVGGALLAVVAACAWLVERVTGQPNALGVLLEYGRTKAVWLLLLLAFSALWTHWQFRLRKFRIRHSQ